MVDVIGFSAPLVELKWLKERVRAEAEDMFVLYLRTANRPNGKKDEIHDPKVHSW